MKKYTLKVVKAANRSMSVKQNLKNKLGSSDAEPVSNSSVEVQIYEEVIKEVEDERSSVYNSQVSVDLDKEE